MTGLRWIVARVRGLWRRDGIAAEIDEELQFHVAARTEQYERDGLTHDDARRKARARIGSVAIHLDRGYDVRGAGAMDSIGQDIRHTIRVLRRQPGFTAIAVITLALGIGASTAMFSVIDAALLRPLPYPAPEQIVEIEVAMRQSEGTVVELGPSLDDAAAWRNTTSVFSHLTSERTIGQRVLDGVEPVRLDSAFVTSDYLPLYGATPIAGRVLTPADEQPDAPAVAVINERLWRQHFNGEASIVGKTITYDGATMTVVGVVPASFRRGVSIWRPLIATADLHSTFKVRRGSGGSTIGRLRPGVSIEDAQQVLTAATPAQVGMPAPASPPRVILTSAIELKNNRYRPTIITLAGSIALVVIIACVNVAGLLLARGATRQSEVAVRTSLGASRWRLIRQFLTESMVIAAAGGALGIALAWLTLQTLVANIPLTLPQDSPAQLSVAVLVATAALTILTAVVFGLVPALRLSRQRLGPTMARAGRQHSVALTRRGGQSLIAVEVALAVIMLAGAGLMLRSFSRLVSVEIGFDPSRFVALEVIPVEPVAAVQSEFYASLLHRVRQLPAVAAAGAIDFVPLAGGGSYTSARAGERSSSVAMRQVLPGYFEAVGLPLLAGRLPVDADVAAAEKPIVLSTAAAEALFPGIPPVGRQVEIGKITRTVIGVVPNVQHNGPMRLSTRPEVYFAYEPTAENLRRARGVTLIVAPRGVSPTLAADLKRVATEIGPRVIVGTLQSGDQLFRDGVALPRRRTVMLSILGGFGLLLSIVGVVGMTSYAVARRTREIGVRMAFGARADQVVRAMLFDSVWPIAIGVGLGLAGAWLSTGVIKSFLFETTPTDPATLAAVALTLAAAGVLAAWIPARRAARVDPVSALRAE